MSPDFFVTYLPDRSSSRARFCATFPVDPSMSRSHFGGRSALRPTKIRSLPGLRSLGIRHERDGKDVHSRTPDVQAQGCETGLPAKRLAGAECLAHITAESSQAKGNMGRVLDSCGIRPQNLSPWA